MFIRHQGVVTQIIFMPGKGVNVTVYFYNPDKKRINDGKRTETMWPAASLTSGCRSPCIPDHFQYGEKGNNSRAIQRLAINCRQTQKKDKQRKKLINNLRGSGMASVINKRIAYEDESNKK